MPVEPEKTGKNQEIRDARGRFVPGVSGNPAGKPKGIKHMTTLLEEAIKKVAEDTGSSADVEIVRKVIEKARKGDMKAIEHIWDRLEGKAQQKLDHTTDGEAMHGVVILPPKHEDSLETPTETGGSAE